MQNTNKSKIRNFCIIAHIDHGKSTLSDRIIEITNGVDKRQMQEQILDSMELERERGITIKLNAVQLKYGDYVFHLIDTPGHIDFNYEVSRSLAACEGAILVVDATQGVQAQTLTNVYLAIENNLNIIPVINKVDLPSADVDKVKKDIEEIIGLTCANAPCVSAKSGLNIESELIPQIIEAIPAPILDDDTKPLQALIFDSYYDPYRGAICYVRVKNGVLKVGQKIKLMASNREFNIVELGIKTPNIITKKELRAGEVGWVNANIKSIKDINVGDTITDSVNQAPKPLVGYKKINPMVYCGFYPIDNSKYDELKEAIGKINLSDASLVYEYETSQSLGFGVRCGFLGLLHLDIIQERILREFNISLISTAPSVLYKVYKTDGEVVDVDAPSKLPDRTHIKHIEEPFVKLEIITPTEYVGVILDLCQKHRGQHITMDILDDRNRKIVYEMPLSEIIFSFFDKLKSISHGYASMEYDLIGYKKQDLVKVDILLNGEKVDALSMICHKERSYQKSKVLVEKLKEHIPRHQFEIPIQAAIGGKIIARETIRALFKNVLAKCYGGDVSRKKKLLEQQKEGKKKLKRLGTVDVPQDVFIKILSED